MTKPLPLNWVVIQRRDHAGHPWYWDAEAKEWVARVRGASWYRLTRLPKRLVVHDAQPPEVWHRYEDRRAAGVPLPTVYLLAGACPYCAAFTARVVPLNQAEEEDGRLHG